MSFQSTTKGSTQPDVWFIFQKSKYLYDWSKKSFRTIEFPINKTYEEYMESRGYLDDEAIDTAEKEFGRNEMIMVNIAYVTFSIYMHCYIIYAGDVEHHYYVFENISIGQGKCLR